MTLIDKVRAATQVLHHQLDYTLIPRIEAVHSKDDYAALLLLFYGFFKPVYDSIDTHINADNLPDYQYRRRPEWILNDLDTLAVEYDVQLCHQLPIVTDDASAFGALYVLEGSTLGGTIIKKMISGKTGLDEGLSFFGGYGRHTKERWNVFIEALNNRDNHNEAAERTIQTAATTFTMFKDWLQQAGITIQEQI